MTTKSESEENSTIEKIQEWNYNDPNHKPPFNTDYTEMPAHENLEINAIAIGKDGCNLKKITENNKIAYIYHNKESGKFELWGHRNKFAKVQKQIQNHLDYAVRIVSNRNIVNTLD
tara:strand:+ start:698 stop:1045 length:348 start_codon:yes stop_codon:yes gene_type:complete